MKRILLNNFENLSSILKSMVALYLFIKDSLRSQRALRLILLCLFLPSVSLSQQVIVEICNAPTYSDATIKEIQTIKSSSDSLITFDFQQGNIKPGNAWLFVTNQQGIRNNQGVPIVIEKHYPVVTEISKRNFCEMDSILLVKGEYFSPIPPVVELTNHIDYSKATTKVTQFTSVSSDTSIEMQLDPGSLDFGKVYLFITNGSGQRNEQGFELYYWSSDWKPQITEITPSVIDSTVSTLSLSGRYFGSDIDNCSIELVDNHHYDQAAFKQAQFLMVVTDTLAQFELQMDEFPEHTDTLYAFFTNPAGLRNDIGYPVPIDPSFTYVKDELNDLVIRDYHLFQNYPNPFNDSSIIRYQLPDFNTKTNWHMVDLSIYNETGQMINRLLHKIQGPGKHQVVWKGCDEKGNSVSSGLYFYVLKVDNNIQFRKKMVYLK